MCMGRFLRHLCSSRREGPVAQGVRLSCRESGGKRRPPNAGERSQRERYYRLNCYAGRRSGKLLSFVYRPVNWVPMAERTAHVKRATKETQIDLKLNVDGT